MYEETPNPEMARVTATTLKTNDSTMRIVMIKSNRNVRSKRTEGIDFNDERKKLTSRAIKSQYSGFAKA